MLQRREQLGYSHHFELVRMTEGGWSCLAVHLFHLVPGSNDLPSTFFYQTKLDVTCQATLWYYTKLCLGGHCRCVWDLTPTTLLSDTHALVLPVLPAL